MSWPGDALLRKRERVDMLARNGYDTSESKRTLGLFARTLDIFEHDLRRLLAEDRNRFRL
jgi:hypothetical protein